jgi:hypothetical protein
VSKREARLIYCLGVPAMLKSSPMLRSIYSCVKEPLRITPSKYKDYKLKKRGRSGIGGIGIGEGKRENIGDKHT